MSTNETSTGKTDVYLSGDSEAIRTTLTTEEVIGKLVDIVEMQLDRDIVVFLTLPMVDHDRPAFVRPSSIVALVPACDDE